jgi:ABC-2 type transport system ATP-binding protein
MAMIHDPEVLILDEPTGGLDPNQVIEIRELIRNAGKRQSVLFSSHILSEVEAIADRVVIINKGNLLADTPISELQNQFAVESRFSVEFEKTGFSFGWTEKLGTEIGLETLSDTRFVIHVSKDTDLRKLIYEQSIVQENPILSLTKSESSLEDIFRQVTTQN